jgi:AcrR family transcriptional regulator
MVELLRSTCAREVEVVRAIAEGDGPARHRLADALQAFVERALKGDRLAYAIVAEPASVEIEDARQEVKRELALIFAGLVEDAAAAGDVSRQDPNIAGACIVGAMLEGLMGPLARDRADEDDEAVATGIVAFCLRALGPDKNAKGEPANDGHLRAIR